MVLLTRVDPYSASEVNLYGNLTNSTWYYYQQQIHKIVMHMYLIWILVRWTCVCVCVCVLWIANTIDETHRMMEPEIEGWSIKTQYILCHNKV